MNATSFVKESSDGGIGLAGVLAIVASVVSALTALAQAWSKLKCNGSQCWFTRKFSASNRSLFISLGASATPPPPPDGVKVEEFFPENEPRNAPLP